MRIAIPYEEGNVFQHFGKSKQFKLYTVEDGKIVSSEVISAGDTGHEALAGLLAELDVKAVICGGLGQGMMRTPWRLRGLMYIPASQETLTKQPSPSFSESFSPEKQTATITMRRLANRIPEAAGTTRMAAAAASPPKAATLPKAAAEAMRAAVVAAADVAAAAAVTWKSFWMEKMPERRFMSTTRGPSMTGHSSTPRTIAASHSPSSAGPA